MDITVNSQVFAQELRLVEKIVASKPAIPILVNVRIDVDSQLRLFTSDLELGLVTTCPATVHKAGSITVNCKRLLDMIDQLPDADVRLTLDKHFLRIVSGSFISKLHTLPAEDFMLPPVFEGDAHKLPADAMSVLITRTRYAIADKAQKHFMAGALMTLTPELLALVATDGKRLSLATKEMSAKSDTSVVLPAKFLDTLLALDLQGSAVFGQNDMNIYFQMGQRLLVSRKFDGTFPAYERIIPRTHDKKVIVKRSLLQQMLRRVSLASGDSKAIILTFASGSLHGRAMNVDVGEAAERISVNYDGEEVTLSINWEYMLDFLNVATGENVTLEMQGAMSPVLMTDGTEFLNVVMTMRL